MNSEKELVDKNLKNKIKFFIFMFLLSTSLAIHYISTDVIEAKYPLFAFLIGLSIGVILSRIQKVSWDKDSEKIIKEFDLISGILLFFLILFLTFKTQLINSFVELPKVNSIIFSLNAGMMLGRTVTLRHRIFKILKSKN